MRTRIVLALTLGLLGAGTFALDAQTKPATPPPAQARPAAAPAAPVIVLETAKGTIEIETAPQDAPKSVAHVLALVRRGFYRGLRFHWVQSSVIQIGDPLTRNMGLPF